MDEKIGKVLDEKILERLNGLDDLPPEKLKEELDAIQVLSELRMKEEKNALDAEKLEADKASAEQHKRDLIYDVVKTTVMTVVPLFGYGWMIVKGLKFEETGVFTSGMVKDVFRTFPKFGIR